MVAKQHREPSVDDLVIDFIESVPSPFIEKRPGVSTGSRRPYPYVGIEKKPASTVYNTYGDPQRFRPGDLFWVRVIVIDGGELSGYQTRGFTHGALQRI